MCLDLPLTVLQTGISLQFFGGWEMGGDIEEFWQSLLTLPESYTLLWEMSLATSQIGQLCGAKRWKMKTLLVIII